jgi:hypothetical protein
MKRIATGLILLTGLAGTASAHTLAGDEGLLLQLDHQVLGLHHLPITILLVVAGVWLIRRVTRKQLDE